MKKLVLSIVALSLAGLSAQAQKKSKPAPKATTTVQEAAKPAPPAVVRPGYEKTESGIYYKFLTKGSGAKAQLGDHITLHIVTSIGDSMLFNSVAMNNNEPVPLPPLQAPAYRGDIMEIIAMANEGDHISISTPLDSMLKAGAQALPWMEKDKGMMVDYDVRIVSVKSDKQVKEDARIHAERQVALDDSLIQDYLKRNKIKATKTASGLYYTIHTPGKGVAAKAGEKVTVNYTGKTLNGEKFDSNVDPAFGHVEPFSFTLGQGQVIKGWDEGIALLKKGGKLTLFIPSGLAYGAQSPSPKIPANSVLIFDVDMP